MSLDSQLQRWQHENLLSPEQAERIRAFERRQPGAARWVVWALSGLGALAIVAGLISVIAANWEDLPSGVKLAGGVGLLLLALGGAARLEGWGRDLCLLLHGGLVLANVALVGQVYHLAGPPWRVFAVCAAFSLPAIFIGRRALLTDLFLAYLLATLLTGLDALGLFERLGRQVFGMGFVLASLGIVALMVRAAIAREEPGFALRRWASGLLGVTVVWAATGWASNRTLRAWANLSPQLPDYLPLLAFTLLAGALLAYFLFWRVDRPAAVATAAGLLLLGLPPLLPVDTHLFARQFLGFALFAALTVALTFAAAARNSRLWTNLFSLAFAARIFVLYLELVKDLMSTGLSLLATGAVLCALAWGWWRVSSRVVPKLEVAR